MKADRNEPIDTDMQDTFPKNELGEISQHIIQIYKRLHHAKEGGYVRQGCRADEDGDPGFPAGQPEQTFKD